MAPDTSCFDSALVDLERVEKVLPDFVRDRCRILSNKISYLRIFHQSATKWGNGDAGLRALLVRIEDAVSKIAQDILPYCLCWDYSEFPKSLLELTEYAKSHIDSFKKEINRWYIKFSDCSSQSYSQDSDELEEFIGSLLGTVDFLCSENYSNSALVYLLDALKDNLIFLKNFIRFAKLRGGIDHDTDLGQNLMIHIKAVAICAAHHCYMCQFGTEDDMDDEEDANDEDGDDMVDEDNTDNEDGDKDDMVDEDDKNVDDKDGEDDINDDDGDEDKYDMVDGDDNPKMKFKIAGLLQRIKPVDPHVYMTYIQALNGSKLSRQLHTPTLEILGDFIASLLSYLFEVLKDGTNPVLSTKNDQLHILYEGLRSLSTILKKQLKNFDEKAWDVIWVLVCDAGLVIFSLFSDATEDGFPQKMDSLLSDLLERIKFIRAKVVGVSPKGGSSMFNFPKVNELGFIDFLLDNLMDQLTSWKEAAGSTAIPKHQIQTIYDELVFFRSFLGKNVSLRDEKEEIRVLWNRVVELAYKIEFLIDSLVIGGLPHDFSCRVSFDSITQEINNIKLNALKISGKEGVDKIIKKSNNLLPLESSMPKIEDEIIGFDDVAALIIRRLKRGARQLQIVGIVGMAGQGKTTLAKMIYNDFSIVSHFHVLAWCCISQVYNMKNMLLEILTCIPSELPMEYYMMSEDDLALELYQKLKRKRYLIILDDMWDINAWNSMRESFPDDATESRILLTSRLRDVVNELDQEAHFLRQLTDDESRKLLKAKLFLGHDWPPNLCELSTQIVERCKGLPLTIVIVARILATMEQDCWKEVVERLSSSTTPILEQCKNTLELSYIYLPDELKPCILYFGAFPEDQEFTPDKLAWLWIAEGFIRKTKSQSLEDKAKDYLKQLISRSLVTIDKWSSTGHVKTCHIHDLLHEFCVKKAREERFFQLLQGNDELSSFDEQHNVRRLCIHSKPEHFKESRLFCPQVRCVLFFNSDKWFKETYFNPLLYIGMSKFVKVLDLSQIPLGGNFPGEIGLLVQLGYLEIRGEFRCIPPSIANLSNLETLIVHMNQLVYLPDNIWNLKKLRHLQSTAYYTIGFFLPRANLDNSAELCNLDTFSTAILYWENLEKTLMKFPNIRTLKCELRGKLIKRGTFAGESKKVLIAFDHISQLESLNFSSHRRLSKKLQIEVSFPLNLRKLTMSDIRLPSCKMSVIGNLPNLVALKLYGAFEGEDWNMEDSGQFPKLKFLKLAHSTIVRWTVSESVEDPFPSLVKLVLNFCDRLEKVPSCLKDSSSLQMIKVYYCSDSALSSIKQIQEEQESMGNEDFKVVIGSFWHRE